MEITRRNFLTGAAAMGGLAAFGLAGCAPKSVQADADEALAETGGETSATATEGAEVTPEPTPDTPAAGDNPYYLGKHNDTGYYFYYEPQRITVLDYAFLATITEKIGGTVIYADRCSIDDSKLSQMGIVFKKIPRDISRL